MFNAQKMPCRPCTAISRSPLSGRFTLARDGSVVMVSICLPPKPYVVDGLVTLLLCPQGGIAGVVVAHHDIDHRELVARKPADHAVVQVADPQGLGDAG